MGDNRTVHGETYPLPDDDLGIQYPIARAEDGTAVHISRWQRSQVVTCFGCKRKLIGRLPQVIRPHFAHKADDSCNRETALHFAMKVAIEHACAVGTLRYLEWECPHDCRRCTHRTDIGMLEVLSEDHRHYRRPDPRVGSDVLGRDVKGSPRVAIEVVCSHDIDDETLVRYHAIDGLGVFSVEVTDWGIIADILSGAELLLVKHRGVVPDAASCPGCQQLQREKQENEAREERRRFAYWAEAWVNAWKHIGATVVADAGATLSAVERDRRQEERARARWWDGWVRAWSKIGAEPAAEWWSAWKTSWREIGAEHVREPNWWHSWLQSWEEVCRTFVKDEAALQRQRVVDAARAAAAVSDWWRTWILAWNDIGNRASGATAAWKPICRLCHADLTPDHRCP